MFSCPFNDYFPVCVGVGGDEYAVPTEAGDPWSWSYGDSEQPEVGADWFYTGAAPTLITEPILQASLMYSQIIHVVLCASMSLFLICSGMPHPFTYLYCVTVCT